MNSPTLAYERAKLRKSMVYLTLTAGWLNASYFWPAPVAFSNGPSTAPSPPHRLVSFVRRKVPHHFTVPAEHPRSPQANVVLLPPIFQNRPCPCRSPLA